MSADELGDDEADETIEADPAEILDPADYNQNQRLKEIHQARKDVRDHLQERPIQAKSSEWEGLNARLAEAVAFYGHELLPLMNEAGWSHEFPDEIPFETVREFVRRMGKLPSGSDSRTPSPPITMIVFDRLNEFTREVGLGTNLDEGSDEWEV